MPVSKQQEAMISDMSKRGMDVDTISSITGVSTQDVQDTINSQQTTPSQVNQFGPIEGIRSIDNIDIPSASRYGGERAQIGFSTPYALESIGVPYGYGNISVNNPLSNPSMFSGVRSLEDLSRALDPNITFTTQDLMGVRGLGLNMGYGLMEGPYTQLTYQRPIGGPKGPDLRSFMNNYDNPFGSIGSFAESMANAVNAPDEYGGGFNDSGGPDSSETGMDTDDSGYGGGVTGGSFGE